MAERVDGRAEPPEPERLVTLLVGRNSRLRRITRSIPVIGTGIRAVLIAYHESRSQIERSCRELRERRLPEARDAAAIAAGVLLSKWARKLLLIPYRDERVDLPPPVVVARHSFDIVDDLVEFTSLAPELVHALLSRQLESFRTEWLQWPESLRRDHWFYLSSRMYLFGNSVHFHDEPTVIDDIAGLLSGRRILDFGGGTGNLSLALAARGFDIDYRELSALQKDFMRFRVQRHGMQERITILDAWEDLSADAYDAILAFDVLEHLPDLPQAMEQLARSLVDDGLLIDTQSFTGGTFNPMHHEDPGLESLLAACGIAPDRTTRRFRVWKKGGGTSRRLPGQLDNGDLERVVARLVHHQSWQRGARRIAVEVGTGCGEGSTVAIHRALTASQCQFHLIGYEGDQDLAGEAAARWSSAEDVDVLNEYFMYRDDIERVVKPSIRPADRDAYLCEFNALMSAENFLATPPPGAIDLLFIDSVRYTHLAILRAAAPWFGPETVVLMEDDIPGYGELAIVRGAFELHAVTTHEIHGHPWPLVEFKLARWG